MERLNKEIPLYLQSAEWIRSDIKNGVIRPGEKLASEHDMMKKYNVSRMTVRNAFSELVNEGLVEKYHGKGSFCRETAAKKNIDVLLNMSDHYFISYYLQSISAVLERNNANMLAGDTRNSNTEIVKRLNAIAARGSNGVILQGCPKPDWDPETFSEAMKRLEEKGIPVIVIDYVYPLERICSAAMNEKKIGKIAADYLFEKGHRKVAAVCILDDALSQKRLEGFSERFAEYTEIKYNNEIAWQIRAAMAAGATALFCYNDTVAQECIDSLREEGYTIPDDLSVISVDDTILARVYGITSVAHAKNRIGEYAAVQILSNRLESKIFDPVLVERASVKAVI